MTDRTGQIFGQLTVTSFSHRVGGVYYWNCLCSCGTEKKVQAQALMSGMTKTCGCAKRLPRTDLQKQIVSRGLRARGKGRISEETRRKLSEGHKGEKSYLWRGGITPINKALRSSLEYRQWRDAVFQRDGYLCVDCGDGGYLEAHHIKAFADYPDLRFDLTNGKTLCIKCHAKTDNYKKKRLMSQKTGDLTDHSPCCLCGQEATRTIAGQPYCDGHDRNPEEPTPSETVEKIAAQLTEQL